MQSIREMSDEFNKKFLKNSSKIILSFGLLIMMYTSCNLIFTILSGIISEIFKNGIPTIILSLLFCSIFYVYIILNYGFMILITRLERNQSSSIGYLFLGFKHKRITGASLIFTLLFVASLVISVLPVYLNENLTTVESFQNFLADKDKLFQYAVYAVLIFILSFIILFYMFSFVWIIIYDCPEIKGIKSFAKSFKIMKSNIFKFLGFVIFVNLKYILIILLVELFDCLCVFVFKSNAGYLINFVLSIAVLISFFRLIERTNFAIPFYYDKLNESTD